MFSLSPFLSASVCFICHCQRFSSNQQMVCFMFPNLWARVCVCGFPLYLHPFCGFFPPFWYVSANRVKSLETTVWEVRWDSVGLAFNGRREILQRITKLVISSFVSYLPQQEKKARYFFKKWMCMYEYIHTHRCIF